MAGPDRELVRTYYYNSAYDPLLATEQSKTQQSFFDSLRKTPYLDLRLGRLVSGADGNFKTKGEKTIFSSDLVYFAARSLFDTAIVVTEDADFSPVLNLVKEFGRAVEIGFFRDSQPSELIKASDRIFPLSEVLEKFSSKIFPSIPEENIGNSIFDKHAPLTQSSAQVAKPRNSLTNFKKISN